MGQESLKYLTLDLGSGLDLRVVCSSPVFDFMLGVEPTLKKVILKGHIAGKSEHCP